MCEEKVKRRAVRMGATSDLHFRVHAAADVGHAPGGAGSDLSVGQRREDGLLVLVEGLQRGVLAGTPELESATHHHGDCCFTTRYAHTRCAGWTAHTTHTHTPHGARSGSCVHL